MKEIYRILLLSWFLSESSERNIAGIIVPRAPKATNPILPPPAKAKRELLKDKINVALRFNKVTEIIPTNEIGKAIVDVKKGKIDFKVDKTGIIHASVGKVSFDPKKIEENANELLNTVKKLKPSSSKGVYFKSISLSSTMSSSIKIDSSALAS